MNNILFSVVIPTYERPEMLRLTLDCLRNDTQSYGIEGNKYEVIVTDDSRSEETANMVESYYPWVKYTKGPQKGPAANRNHGADQAQGEWIAFTDDDCLPDAHWLQAFANQTNHAEVLEGKTITDRPRLRLDEESPVNETGGYLWSCNMATHRELFQNMGGFNEGFPYPAIEDVELNEKIKKAQIPIPFCKEAIVVHPWRRSKGITHLKQELSSWYYLLGLYPELRPPSLTRYFFHRSFRTFIKVTFPRLFKYRFKGAGTALGADAFYFWQGIRALFRKE